MKNMIIIYAFVSALMGSWAQAGGLHLHQIPIRIANHTQQKIERIRVEITLQGRSGNPFGSGSICGQQTKAIEITTNNLVFQADLPAVKVSCKTSFFKTVFNALIRIDIPDLQVILVREFQSNIEKSISYEISNLSLYKMVPQNINLNISLKPGESLAERVRDYRYLQYRLNLSFAKELPGPTGAAEQNSRTYFNTISRQDIQTENVFVLERSLGQSVIAVRGDLGPNPEVNGYLILATQGNEGVLIEKNIKFLFAQNPWPQDLINVLLK